ncbi:hypothetical protein, partial [Psychrobacter sp. TB55-MNA-CIBAN-0194]
MIDASQRRYYVCFSLLVFATLLTPIFAASFGAANIDLNDVLIIFNTLWGGDIPSSIDGSEHAIELSQRI